MEDADAARLHPFPSRWRLALRWPAARPPRTTRYPLCHFVRFARRVCACPPTARGVGGAALPAFAAVQIGNVIASAFAHVLSVRPDQPLLHGVAVYLCVCVVFHFASCVLIDSHLPRDCDEAGRQLLDPESPCGTAPRGPGRRVVPRPAHNHHDGDHGDHGSGAQQSTPTFCVRCAAPRPVGAHHCSVCQCCVAARDHHCVFVGTCVGANNHRHFVLFLAYLAVGTSMFLVLSYPVIVPPTPRVLAFRQVQSAVPQWLYIVLCSLLFIPAVTFSLLRFHNPVSFLLALSSSTGALVGALVLLRWQCKWAAARTPVAQQGIVGRLRAGRKAMGGGEDRDLAWWLWLLVPVWVVPVGYVAHPENDDDHHHHYGVEAEEGTDRWQ